MLGKRGRRPPMKRTTSMKEFAFDLTASSPTNSSRNSNTPQDKASLFNAHPQNHGGDGQRYDDDNLNTAAYLMSAAPPQRRSSADFVETAQFLRLCSLCNRRLVPGHDIYMYRGDNAFCSSECRQRKMAQDERKDKKLMEATANAVVVAAVPQVSAAAGETVTAAV